MRKLKSLNAKTLAELGANRLVALRRDASRK
jgi:hypothetical protein